MKKSLVLLSTLFMVLSITGCKKEEQSSKQETHALWRDFKLTMGSSANQVKPVRILDAPIKQKFFFGLLEPGQEVPDLYFLEKR